MGKTGIASTELWPEGQVRIAGEIWQARCQGGCNAGTKVVVRAVEGLTLVARPPRLGGLGESCRGCAASRGSDASFVDPPRSQAGLQWAAMRVASLAPCCSSSSFPAALGASTAWETRAPLPVPRTEVAAAAFGGEIAVVGGFNLDGTASRRADAYSPTRDRWRRLPDLPVGAHHAMAVGAGGRLYVLGGYWSDGRRSGACTCSTAAAGGYCRACPSRVPPPVRASRAAGSWSRAA